MRWLLILAAGCTADPKTQIDETPEEGVLLTDADGDGYLSDEDCEDDDPTIHPGADELCDGFDNNCNGQSDEEVTETFYADADGDGFGNDGISVQDCVAPTGFVSNGSDCDDAFAQTYPSAEEICDDLDNDCNGTVDDGLDQPFFEDADGDGFGNEALVVEACDLRIGLSAVGGDCDDTSADISPSQEETCDGSDNDCNGQIDEGTDSIFYADADEDGFGDVGEPFQACNAPAGYVGNSEDCNDLDTLVNPAIQEICDGQDNDCDGQTDEGDAQDASLWYADFDGDGYGDEGTTQEACSQPLAHVPVAEDCDDGQDDVNPAAQESCNGIDDDCDGQIDEEASDATVWFSDADQDGYGDPDSSQEACSTPTGHVQDATDCDDHDDDISPAATETCNGEDDNCNGATDEQDAEGELIWYEDQDLDGYGDPGTAVLSCTNPGGLVDNMEDCDDLDPAAYPGAAELCGVSDLDCDGTEGDSDLDASDGERFFLDHDADGFGDPGFTVVACTAPESYVQSDTDCDDLDPSAFPGSPEVCDGLDNDCDGTEDDADELAFSDWFLDSDGDGFGDLSGEAASACQILAGHSESSDDCDDGDSSVNPEGVELCDGIDNDCSGTADEGSAQDASAWYPDLDSDGYGGQGSEAVSACTEPEGHSENALDCQDGDPDISPDDPELCDGIDNNCDGEQDEDGAEGGAAWYADVDGDGYGNPDSLRVACGEPEGHAANALDCQDADPDISPDDPELCDGLDNDCDGQVDEDGAEDGSNWYLDNDSDGFGSADALLVSCSQPEGHVSNGLDCGGDGNGAQNPDAAEICNGIDDDCSGTVDGADAEDIQTWYLDADGDGYGDDDVVLEACDQPEDYLSIGGDNDDGDGSRIDPESCLAALGGDPAAESGTYVIDPAGDFSEVEVYCDMDTDGGGWTLLMKQAAQSGPGSDLAVNVWAGWSTPGETLNPEDATMDDANMVNPAYSDLHVTTLRMTASSGWTDIADGAFTRSTDGSAYDALSDNNANLYGNLGGNETGSWSSQPFSSSSTSTSDNGYGLCWRSGPYFNQTSIGEYTYGGTKWGWFYNNECGQSTADTTEGLGCCGNSSWYKRSAWTLYVWGR
jgi:large repetitive protein